MCHACHVRNLPTYMFNMTRMRLPTPMSETEQTHAGIRGAAGGSGMFYLYIMHTHMDTCIYSMRYKLTTHMLYTCLYTHLKIYLAGC